MCDTNFNLVSQTKNWIFVILGSELVLARQVLYDLSHTPAQNAVFVMVGSDDTVEASLLSYVCLYQFLLIQLLI
jgi:hypothetical protein